MIPAKEFDDGQVVRIKELVGTIEGHEIFEARGRFNLGDGNL